MMSDGTMMSWQKERKEQISLLYKMAEVETVEEQVTSLCSHRAPEVRKIKNNYFLFKNKLFE